MWGLFVLFGVLLGSAQAAPPLEVSLLETLCNAFGPSGFEEEVQQIVQKQGRKFADEILYAKTTIVQGRFQSPVSSGYPDVLQTPGNKLTVCQNSPFNSSREQGKSGEGVFLD